MITSRLARLVSSAEVESTSPSEYSIFFKFCEKRGFGLLGLQVPRLLTACVVGGRRGASWSMWTRGEFLFRSARRRYLSLSIMKGLASSRASLPEAIHMLPFFVVIYYILLTWHCSSVEKNELANLKFYKLNNCPSWAEFISSESCHCCCVLPYSNKMLLPWPHQNCI